MCLQDSGLTVVSSSSLDLFSRSVQTPLCLGPLSPVTVTTANTYKQAAAYSAQSLGFPSYTNVCWLGVPSPARQPQRLRKRQSDLPVLAGGGGRLLWCPSGVTSQSCFVLVFFLTWFYLPAVKFTWKQNCICSFCGQNEKLEEYRKSLETRRQWKNIPVFAILSQRSFN